MDKQIPGLHRFRSCKLIARPLVMGCSLVLLSLSVLLLADLLGLRKSSLDAAIDTRRIVVEALVVDLSTLASKGEKEKLSAAVTRFVLGNRDVRAVSLVRDSGDVLAELGDTREFDGEETESSLDQMRISVYGDNRLWGELRVAFEPLVDIWQEVVWFGFIALVSLLAFTAFLNRALVQLDPARAVPKRVDSAMNLFSAGVLVLDSKLRIVMANKSAANIARCAPSDLRGKTLDSWFWKKGISWQAPWTTTLHSGLAVSDEPMILSREGEEDRSLLVSCAFVGDSEEGRIGVLVTLDDMTTIERQNRELEILATTDALTGIANRRTLMAELNRQMKHAQAEGTPLACIMTDIDHFKQVNDNYGHAVGDDVIKSTAQVMRQLCREVDVIGRYGGEEFVIVLPGMSASEAAQVAERARINIMALAEGEQLALPKLSSSFGVSDLTCGAQDGKALVDAADQGLYSAKEAGRNRVVIYEP